MFDYARFVELVRDALSNLHNQPVLRDHPLGGLLAQNGGVLTVHDLQRTLIDAVQQLRPEETGQPASTQSSVQWRRYRHLWLRYVEGIGLPQIANTLGVTERQSRRHHQEGLEAVSHALWLKCRRAQWTHDPVAEALDSGGQPDASALGAELNKLDAELPPGPTSLPEVLDGVLSAAADLIKKHRLDFRVALPADVPPVALHRLFLRQVLLSLVSRLVALGPGAQASLAVEPGADSVVLRCLLSEPSELALPPGAPTQSAQATPSASRSASASDGGPLEVVRRLLEARGGSLAIAAVGSGRQELALRLPVAHLATVLVVDDNPDFLALFRRYLEQTPYRVLQAAVADEALRIARERRPDIVVLDVLMPTLDGWELLDALRRDPRTQDIPIVVCSVLREANLALEFGAVAFMPKPVTPLTLLATLERARTSRAER